MGVATLNRTAIQQCWPQTEATTSEKISVVHHQHVADLKLIDTQAAKIIKNTQDSQFDSEKRLRHKSRK